MSSGVSTAPYGVWFDRARVAWHGLRVEIDRARGLAAALAHAVAGEIRFDAAARAMYAADPKSR